MKKTCKVCQKQFESYRSSRLYCSQKCSWHVRNHNAYWKNPEHHRKRCGDRYWLYKKNAYEHLRKVNMKAKARQRFGELRESILARFNNKCAACGSKRHLVVHHLDNNGRKAQAQGREPNNNKDNLMVVCASCHVRHHRWGLKLEMKI